MMTMPDTLLRVDIGDSEDEQFEVHWYPDTDREVTTEISRNEAKTLGNELIELLAAGGLDTTENETPMQPPQT